jgi:hypothetical protein
LGRFFICASFQTKREAASREAAFQIFDMLLA